LLERRCFFLWKPTAFQGQRTKLDDLALKVRRIFELDWEGFTGDYIGIASFCFSSACWRMQLSWSKGISPPIPEYNWFHHLTITVNFMPSKIEFDHTSMNRNVSATLI